MSGLDIEEVIVVVKHGGRFLWFKSDRELWVLDLPRRVKFFAAAGIDGPDVDPSERFGIPVVNEQTMDRFLKEMQPFEIDKSTLGKQLTQRFPDAESWWDVGDLFPIMFVDCDRRHVAAFYPSGTRMERYVPDGWTSEFDDFATISTEEDFPTSEKFWVQDGVDMLEVLNERGRNLEKQ